MNSEQFKREQILEWKESDMYDILQSVESEKRASILFV